MISRFFDIIIAIIGLIRFKLRYPGVRWIRPRKVGTFYSQDGQDLYLASLLLGPISRNSSERHWVVDVGCNHPINFSNSLFFEKYFGCHTLAIDPIEEFAELWKDKRPNAVFHVCAVGESNGFVDLSVPTHNNADNMFSFVSNGFNKRPDMYFEKRKVQLVKLANIFAEHGIDEVMLLSIDVEGFELSALKGIDFEVVIIRCIVLENNSKSNYGADDIRDFLAERNFVFYARIGHLDDVFLHGTLIRGI